MSSAAPTEAESPNERRSMTVIPKQYRVEPAEDGTSPGQSRRGSAHSVDSAGKRRSTRRRRSSVGETYGAACKAGMAHRADGQSNSDRAPLLAGLPRQATNNDEDPKPCECSRWNSVVNR